MYLEHCREFMVYGSAFFFGSAQLKGMTSSRSGSQQRPAVFIGVNCRGIHLIDAVTKVRCTVKPIDWKASRVGFCVYSRAQNTLGLRRLIVRDGINPGYPTHPAVSGLGLGLGLGSQIGLGLRLGWGLGVRDKG